MGTESATEARSPTQETFQSLLSSSKITRIVYIDDIFAFQNQTDVEQVLGWFSQVLATSQKQALQLISITYPVPDEDIWRVEFREKWDKFTDEEKITLVSSLLGLLNTQLSKDRVVASQLRELFPKEFDYQEVAPSTWVSQRTQILTNISENSRLLCLFDQDLSAASGFSAQGGLSGGGLLKDLLDSNNSPHIICGVLSHTIASIETEHEYQKNFTQDYQIGDLSPKKFLPLTKSRLEDPMKIVDGVKKLLLHELCETLKEATINVLEVAHQEALEEIRRLDVYAFDRIVLKAAHEVKDDTWEIDTIVRLFQIYQRNNVRVKLTDPTTANELCSLVAKTRPVSQVKTVKEEHVYPRVRSVRRGELYETGNLIRHRPLETGDIFVTGIGTAGQKSYILLAQPCDLAVRLTGMRDQEFVSLVPIVKVNNKYSDKKTRLYWQNFWNTRVIIDNFFGDPKALAVLELKDAIAVKTSVLDLAVLDLNGSCRIDIQDTTLPLHLTIGWQSLLNNLINFYIQLDARLKQLKEVLESHNKLDDDLRSKLWEATAPIFSFSSAFPSLNYTAGKFDFGLQRIERYRQPGADGLLKAYTQFLSREAKDFDFAG